MNNFKFYIRYIKITLKLPVEEKIKLILKITKTIKSI